MKRTCIGITGYMGAGKSTVARILSEISGWFPISLDLLGHEAYLDDGVREKVQCHFGSSVLHQNSAVNRKAIGKIVFHSEMEKKWLENLLWPVISKKTRKLITTHKQCILDGVILFPSGLVKYCGCVLIVQAQGPVLQERVQSKGVSEEQWKKILASQTSYLWKEYQDTPILTVNNEGSYPELVSALTLLWQERLQPLFDAEKSTKTRRVMGIE